MLYSFTYNDKLLIVKMSDSTDLIILIDSDAEVVTTGHTIVILYTMILVIVVKIVIKDSDARVPIIGHTIVILYTMIIEIVIKDSDARVTITGYAIEILYTMIIVIVTEISMPEFLSQAMPSTALTRQ